MLENCTALAVADDREWLSRIFEIARPAGFTECRRYGSPGDLAAYRKSTPPFVFLHHKLDPGMIRQVVTGVRGASELETRFVPIIMITADRNQASILNYLQMGFDDILIYPCDPNQVRKRLRAQFDMPQHYFQTQTYFGPDRRKTLVRRDQPEQRNAGYKFYRHFVIQRAVKRGIRVLSSQTNIGSNRLAATA